MRRTPCFLAALALALMLGTTASAGTFFFSTGEPDGRIASGTFPQGRGKIEHESADDFILTSETLLHEASFTGLLLHGGHGEIREVVVQIYRVFPKDSDTTRTIHVPTRTNSPGDVEFDSRHSTVPGELSFTVTLIDPHFKVANSVLEDINPSPNQSTGGEGPVAGQEVRIDVVFEKPFDLPMDHYFFVPQVQLQGEGGSFLWLSAPGPPLFLGDLQMWVRERQSGSGLATGRHGYRRRLGVPEV